MTDPMQPQTTTAAAPADAAGQGSGIDPSKVTIVAAALTTVLPLIPGVGPILTGWLGANPHVLVSIIGAVWGGIHMAQVKGWIK